ncbi:hypothetical protein BY458DRAFT_497397 [Sporodiniella umbellata]|nr:hypothetical protein BY458DRAFT_497397 [Sporodiniella umbellata]
MSSERDSLLGQQIQRESRDHDENDNRKYTLLEKILLLLCSSFFIVLCILTGLYVQSVVEKQQPPLKEPLPPLENKTDPVCLTPECILTASQILQDIDINLDPCDNFYQFTCNQWQTRHPIPHDQPNVNSFTMLTDRNKETMRSILSGSFEDLYTPPSGLPDPEQLLDKQNFDKLKGLYVSCLNESLIDASGAQPIYPLMRTLRDQKPLDTLGYLAQQGVNAFFRVQVDIDPNDPQRHILHLMQPTLTLSTSTYYDQPDTIQILYETIVHTLNIVFHSTTEFEWTPYSSNVTARMAVDFEKKLAKITRDDDSGTDTLFLDDIKKQTPQIDWDAYLRIRLPNMAPFPNRMVVRSPQFLTNLNDLLSNEPVRNIQAYLVWKTIDAFVEVLSEPIRKSKKNLGVRLNQKRYTAEKPRWSVCVDHVSDSVGFLLGRYYVLNKTNGKEVKKDVERITSSITKVFLQRLQQLEWLDNETRQAAMKKMGALSSKIGYPDTSPNVLSPISLSEYYGDLEINSTDFFKNHLNCLQLSIRQEWSQIGYKTDRKKWTTKPQEVSTYYNPFLNEIVFPTGILQNPFFGKNYPAYLNYGGIGALIGHELTHGFDRQGGLFDAIGKQKAWWTDKTRSKFDKATRCFIKQYDQFNFTKIDQRPIYTNENRTLAENLADNGGLKLSYLAWNSQTKEQKHLLLPGLNSLSPEQLFFINYGRVWCNKNAFTQDLPTKNRNRSPAEWIVNGAIQNSESFSVAFQCPKGSPMNPTAKCKIW